MLSAYDNPQLSELGLPELVGDSVTFSDHGVDYTLRRESDDTWILEGEFRSGTIPLLSLHPFGDGWRTIEVNTVDDLSRSFHDWRAAVLSGI